MDERDLFSVGRRTGDAFPQFLPDLRDTGPRKSGSIRLIRKKLFAKLFTHSRNGIDNLRLDRDELNAVFKFPICRLHVR